MPYRLAGLLGCLLALSSCLISYKDFPTVDPKNVPLPRKDWPIYYEIKPPEYPLLREYRMLATLFEANEIFSKAIAVSNPPEKGIYVSFDVEAYPPKDIWGQCFFSGIVPPWSIRCIFAPCFCERNVEIEYKLHSNGKRVNSYRYHIRQSMTVWWGFLPITPLAFYNYSFKDDEKIAFQATMLQFLLDAEANGYLQQP